jgi:hypothetical protein
MEHLDVRPETPLIRTEVSKVVLERVQIPDRDSDLDFEDWFTYAVTDLSWAQRRGVREDFASRGTNLKDVPQEFKEKWEQRFGEKKVDELGTLEDGYWNLDLRDLQRYIRTSKDPHLHAVVSARDEDNKRIPIDDDTPKKNERWAPYWMNDAADAIEFSKEIYDGKLSGNIQCAVQVKDGEPRGAWWFKQGDYPKMSYHHNGGWSLSSGEGFSIGLSVSHADARTNTNLLKALDIASQIPLNDTTGVLILENLNRTWDDDQAKKYT